MNRNDMNLNEMQQRLLDNKAELLERLEKIEADMEQGRSRDWDEQAQERENDEVLEGLSVEAQEELRRTNRALARIDDNTYGQCERCDKPIDQQRLQVLPNAEFCVDCA